MKKNPENKFDFVNELADVSRQICAIANLISNQKNADCVPLDIDDLNWGLGKILDRLGRRVKRTALKIEEVELNQNKKTEF